MKKLIFTLIYFAFLASVSAQLNINSSGTYVAKNIYLDGATSFLGTSNNIPVIFKVNNILAGFTGSPGNSNMSFGFRALSTNNTMGYQNVASGVDALRSNTAGSNNTALGFSVLYSNTTGSNNTALGSQTLNLNTIGSYNTAVGCYANVNANNLTNATAIGYNAKATANNQVIIGNSSVTEIGGYASWTTYPSDGRAKKNIRTEVPGLAFINQLQPVMYNLDLDVIDELLKADDPKINAFQDSLRMALSPEEKGIMAKAKENKEKQVYSGFIAQDVEKAAHSIGYDFSGVDAPENGKGSYGLRYAEFVVPLVKAVQELSEQNDKLIEQNNRQQEQINELKAEINELKGNTPVLGARPMQTTDIFTVESDQPAVLYQNAPNPFSQSTEIKYYLPAPVNAAFLCIYDLYGRQLKQIRLSQRGSGSQIISGAEFSAGIYLYALIADGKEIDVKRMILTE